MIIPCHDCGRYSWWQTKRKEKIEKLIYILQVTTCINVYIQGYKDIHNYDRIIVKRAHSLKLQYTQFQHLYIF